MQTSGLPSSHFASTRNAADNSEKPAQTAEQFGDVMHRALSGATAKPNQQKIPPSLFADETARENKSASDGISADKKRARAKRNSEPASVSAPAQLLGMAGAPVAAPQPAAPSAGNAHDSNETKGSTTPVSDDSTTDKTADTIETETAAEAGKPAATTAAAATSAATNSPVTEELTAPSMAANSDPANAAEGPASAESDPPKTPIIEAKPAVTQAGALPPNVYGTSAAKQDMTMKKAEKTTKIAGSVEQDLPGITAASSEELPKGQKVSTREDVRGSEKLETAAIEMPLRVLSSSDSLTPTATVAAPAASPTLDTRVVERTHDIVALHAMRVGEYTSDSLHVVVKPGAGIQLSLELRQSARGIEVRASLHKGDFEQLNQHWPDLQQRLEARGVRLASLATAENFTSTSHQQFQQSKQQSPNQDPLYAGAFAEFALAGSMTEAPAARAARATAYRGWETWA